MSPPGPSRAYALLGLPVAGNPTGAMVEAAWRAAGIAATYLSLDVEPESLAEAIDGLRALGFDGAHVTKPHKVAVVPLLGRLTPSAGAIGAVNCVKREGDVLVGDNTDGKGFVAALLPVRDPDGGPRGGARRRRSGAGDRGRAGARRSAPGHDREPVACARPGGVRRRRSRADSTVAVSTGDVRTSSGGARVPYGAMAASPLAVCISGALGGVGRRLVAAIVASDEFRLHSAVSRREAGRDVGDVVLGAPAGVVLDDDLERALAAGPDVLVDYTHPSVVRRHVELALARRIPVVIGTTGLFDADFDEIDAAARAAGVGAATGNFSLTAALLQHLGRIAARHVPRWEVIEYGAAEKPDVPSGTARELAEVLARERAPVAGLAGDDLLGPPEARGAEISGARVHSIRLPGSGPSVEVVFGAPGERLVIRHDEQGDAGIFVDGTLLAAWRVQELQGLVRGLDTLLFA